MVPKVKLDAEGEKVEAEVSERAKTPSSLALEMTADKPVPARKLGLGSLRGGQVKLNSPETLRAPKRQKTDEEIAAEWALMNDPVDVEGVARAWEAFGQTKEAQEQFNLSATLQSRQPVLDGMRVRFTVINDLQLAQITEIRTELLAHLRRSVRNGRLELQVDVEEAEHEDVPVQFLSDKERYDAMVDRHPLLNELRQRLDLDLS